MLSRLVRRRTIWLPTWAGWLVLVLALGTPAVWWLFRGEAFLSQTDRLPAKVLIVEGWIGQECFVAAKAEFESGGYSWLITSGGIDTNQWDGTKRYFAEEARDALVRMGMPPSEVIAAQGSEADAERTFQAALAVREFMEKRGLHPDAVNVLTIGAHARRSRLVFAKVLGPDTRVGVISVIPNRYPTGFWWHSSERSVDFLKETVGWLFELLVNSGRWSNAASGS